MGIEVGIDIVAVADVAQSLTDHPDRYLDRMCTPRERAQCLREERLSPARVAQHVAAKEAVFKALRPHDEALPWTSVEALRDDRGWNVALDGPARSLSVRRGVEDLRVSIGSARGYVTAVVIAR